MDTLYSQIDFYDKLKLKYNEYLKPEITSVSMVQSDDTVYLEPYSIINTTDIFTDEASEEISKRYNAFGIDK